MPPIVTTPTKPTVPPLTAGGVSQYKAPAPTVDAATFKFPKEIIAIVGESGQGKSYSLRNVDWETTALIDTELKGFPFDHTKIKHYFPCENHAKVEQAIEWLTKNPGTVKVVIIDSLYMYMEKLIRYCKSVYKGYEIYNNYNETLGTFITSLQKCNFIVVCVCMPELVTLTDDLGKNTNQRRIYTYGREHEGKLERYFLIVLYTSMRKTPEGKITYNFLTNNDGISSAKCPPHIFGPDKNLIPNDLSLVLKELNKQ